jgi:hypothetical protein
MLTAMAANAANTIRSYRFGQPRKALTDTEAARRSLRAGKIMAHLVGRRRGDRVSVSSEDGQATITDDGFVGWLLSLGMGLDDPC